jgi:hypothetical protein
MWRTALGRIRNSGGGRKKKAFEDPTLLDDLKKKDMGNFKNNGREWRPKDTPEAILSIPSYAAPCRTASTTSATMSDG